jgi:hypothetical protein
VGSSEVTAVKAALQEAARPNGSSGGAPEATTAATVAGDVSISGREPAALVSR